MSAVTYRHRLNALEPEKLWTLEDRGLRWVNVGADAASGFIPASTIKSVRLRFEPSRAEKRRVGLHIYAPFDHHITNIDYQGVLNFKHQPDEFARFVKAFHALFPSNSETEFHKGSTMGAYIGNIIITIWVMTFLFLLAPILAVTGIPAAGSIFRIGIILLFFPIVFKMLKRNKPGTYNPASPPLEMLQ